MNTEITTIMTGNASEYSLDGNDLLKVTVQYPVFTSRAYAGTVSRLNAEYRRRAKEYHESSVRELYPEAVSQYHESRAKQYPIMEYEAMLVYTITYNDGGMLSLYYDNYQFTGGAHGITVRKSDTWNLQTGRRVPLKDLFPAGFDYQTYITNAAARQAAEQMAKGENQYFEDYQKLIVEHFNEDSFYLNDKGLVVYYQQYDIAPYSSGMPEFQIPWIS